MSRFVVSKMRRALGRAHARTVRSCSFTAARWQLLTCCALLGCSGASWQRVEIDSPYEAPKEIKVAIVARPAQKEASDALSSALLDGLHSHGIQATRVAEATGNPDATLAVVKWDPGSRGLRWLAGLGGGKGEVVVTVESLGVTGTARGWVSGGFLGGSDENSAEAAGSMIADTIATGLREHPAPKVGH